MRALVIHAARDLRVEERPIEAILAGGSPRTALPGPPVGIP
jgi:hypothetical protein